MCLEVLDCGLKVATSCGNHINAYHIRLISLLQTFIVALNLGISLVKAQFSMLPSGMKGFFDITVHVPYQVQWADDG
jgi:hypothetical protein